MPEQTPRRDLKANGGAVQSRGGERTFSECPVLEVEGKLFPLIVSLCIGLFFGVGDRQADQPDRVLRVVDLFQQLFSQREDLFQRLQLLLLRDAAGNLFEIVELDFQRQCVAFETMSFQSFDQFRRRMVQFDDNGRGGGDIFLQGMFRTDGLADADSFDGSLVHPSCEVEIDLPHLAELPYQQLERASLQVFPRVDAEQVHLLRRFGTDAPELFDAQFADEF